MANDPVANDPVAMIAIIERTSVSAKMIYLARRNPALTAEEFPRRWRRHARLASGLPELLAEYRGGAYCHVQPGGELLPGSSSEYDGVAILGLNGVHSIPAVTHGLNASDVTACDELLVFSTYVRDFVMLCQEKAFRESDGGERGMIVVVQFVRARPGMGPSEFVARWDAHGELTIGQPVLDRVLRRHFHNVVVVAPPLGYGFDGISELWFDSLDDLAAARPELDALALEAGAFIDLPTSLTLLTQTIMDWRT